MMQFHVWQASFSTRRGLPSRGSVRVARHPEAWQLAEHGRDRTQRIVMTVSGLSPSSRQHCAAKSRYGPNETSTVQSQDPFCLLSKFTRCDQRVSSVRSRSDVVQYRVRRQRRESRVLCVLSSNLEPGRGLGTSTLLTIEFFSTCLGEVAKWIKELFVVSHLQKVRKLLIRLRIRTDNQLCNLVSAADHFRRRHHAHAADQRINMYLFREIGCAARKRIDVRGGRFVNELTVQLMPAGLIMEEQLCSVLGAMSQP